MRKEIKESRAFYLQRLADLALLKRAVTVKNSRSSGRAGDCLAVPVGESRHGGYLEFTDLQEAEAALRKLSIHQGFPNLRIHDTPDKYEYPIFTLCWGDLQDRIMSVEELGRYYGYKEEAIKQEIEGQRRYYATKKETDC